MDLVIVEIIKNWGLLGAILVGLGYLIYDNWKNNKSRKSESDSVKRHVSSEISILDKKIELVDHKVDCIETNLNERIDNLADRVDDIPASTVEATWIKAEDDNGKHLKQIEDLMLLGGEIHKTLKTYTELINADHIFIGSFHNGNSNLTGIPFCKFDIISECYCNDKVPHDHEFAPVYKDSDILRYGSLFSAVLQSDHMLFNVIPGGDNDLRQYEDIIWRRMMGMGIHQLGVKILRDPHGTPSGFVGIVRYDTDEMNMDRLVQCGYELERIYSINKCNMQDAD